MNDELKFNDLEGNLHGFAREFIIAGPRTNVLSMFVKLHDLGAIIQPGDIEVDVELYPTVILCTNKNKYACITLLSREWWNKWHNPRTHEIVRYKTYNAAKQVPQIIRNLIIDPIPLVDFDILDGELQEFLKRTFNVK